MNISLQIIKERGNPEGSPVSVLSHSVGTVSHAEKVFLVEVLACK